MPNLVLETTTKSHNRFGEMLIWGHEAAKLRKGNYTGVDYKVDGQTILSGVNPQVILDAIDQRLSSYYPRRNGSYFLGIPFTLLNEEEEEDCSQVDNNITTTTIPGNNGISYVIQPNSSGGYIIKRAGLTKTSTLKKVFDTVTQATHYINKTLLRG